jgi:hypothetical protein
MKILQIIPARGWYALYGKNKATAKGGPVACWALVKDGKETAIVGMVESDLQGCPFLVRVDHRKNFFKYLPGN